MARSLPLATDLPESEHLAGMDYERFGDAVKPGPSVPGDPVALADLVERVPAGDRVRVRDDSAPSPRQLHHVIVREAGPGVPMVDLPPSVPDRDVATDPRRAAVPTGTGLEIRRRSA